MALSQLITTIDVPNSNVGINNTVANGATFAVALGNGQSVGIGTNAPLTGLHIGNTTHTIPALYLADSTSVPLPTIATNDGVFSVKGGIPYFTNTVTAPGGISLLASEGLFSNSLYVNAGFNDIQTVLDAIGTNQGDVIYMSAGTYRGVMDATVTITNMNLVSIIAPNVATGFNDCVLGTALNPRALTIDSDSQRIRINSLHIYGLLTIGASAENYFTNLQLGAGITVSASTSGTLYFIDCGISGTITVPSTFTGTIFFIRCSFAGATFALSNTPSQVIIVDCANLSSFNITNATLSGLNANLLDIQINTTTTVYASTGGSITTIEASGNATPVNFTLPSTNGTNTQVLSTDGSGNTSWATVTGSVIPTGATALTGTTGTLVNNASVTAGSTILVTRNLGTANVPAVDTIGNIIVANIVNGASFRIYSTVENDVGNVNYAIL